MKVTKKCPHVWTYLSPPINFTLYTKNKELMKQKAVVDYLEIVAAKVQREIAKGKIRVCFLCCQVEKKAVKK